MRLMVWRSLVCSTRRVRERDGTQADERDRKARAEKRQSEHAQAAPAVAHLNAPGRHLPD